MPKFIGGLLPLQPQCVVALNASPFTFDKYRRRLALFKEIVSKTKAPLIYVNNVGGQDALVFDGGSVVMNEEGNLSAKAPFFKPATTLISLDFAVTPTAPITQTYEERHINDLGLIVDAITLSIQDYVKKSF